MEAQARVTEWDGNFVRNAVCRLTTIETLRPRLEQP
jgi:hypothetical protein